MKIIINHPAYIKNIIGKQTDEESLLADHGVRKYDKVLGQFTCPDPLWEKYYSWTPYQYAGCNPVSLMDGNGKVVETATFEDFSAVNQSVESTYRSMLRFDNGTVAICNTNGEKLTDEQINTLAMTEVGTNFSKLATLVTSKDIYSVSVVDGNEYFNTMFNDNGTISTMQVSLDDTNPKSAAIGKPKSAGGVYLPVKEDDPTKNPPSAVSPNNKNQAKIRRGGYLGLSVGQITAHELLFHGYWDFMNWTSSHKKVPNSIPQTIENKANQ